MLLKTECIAVFRRSSSLASVNSRVDMELTHGALRDGSNSAIISSRMAEFALVAESVWPAVVHSSPAPVLINFIPWPPNIRLVYDNMTQYCQYMLIAPIVIRTCLAKVLYHGQPRFPSHLSYSKSFAEIVRQQSKPPTKDPNPPLEQIGLTPTSNSSRWSPQRYSQIPSLYRWLATATTS